MARKLKLEKKWPHLEHMDVGKVLASVVGLGAKEDDSKQITVASVDLRLVHVQDGFHTFLKVRQRLHFIAIII